jgi:hypothetical protein
MDCRVSPAMTTPAAPSLWNPRPAALLANPGDARYLDCSGFAAIAQPVEHIIRNDGVGGSNPSCGTGASQSSYFLLSA